MTYKTEEFIPTPWLLSKDTNVVHFWGKKRSDWAFVSVDKFEFGRNCQTWTRRFRDLAKADRCHQSSQPYVEYVISAD
jgi:hypothetical protein